MQNSMPEMIRYYSAAGWVEVDKDKESWAPCFHDSDRAKEKKWLADSLGEHYREGEEAETALWLICDQGGSPTCYADQWVGVRTTGTKYSTKEKVETFVMGDTFTLALVQTYLLWRDINPPKTDGQAR